jgi:hypothetical protein
MSRRGLARALAPTALLLALAAPAAGAGADALAAARAASWVQRLGTGVPGGQQADAIVALAAAGRAPAALAPRLRALVRVAPGYARTPGAAAKVVLAAVAAGADPARLGGVDYLGRIRRGYAAGRYGASGVDQALAILAVAATGDRPPAAALSAVRSARGAGGWGFTMGAAQEDDVSTTGLMLEALHAAGVPGRDPAVRSAASWLQAHRNPDGGYAYDGGAGPTEANPTAIAIRGLRAAGRPVPAAARAALRALQGPDGSFAFTARSAGSRVLATLDALPALAGTTLPPPFPRRGGSS